ASVNDLDVRLELRDAAGTTLIAADDPTNSFDATITVSVPAGNYRLAVLSHGTYGDVGKYSVSGTIIPVVDSINAPSNLAGTAISTQEIDLTGTDNATNETGYVVERSSDGSTWAELARIAANSVAYNDSTATAGTYSYRVYAFNATRTSD